MIEPRAVLSYLEHRSRRTFVTGDARQCPLACFLNDTGARRAFVTAAYATSDNEATEILPKPLSEFVRAIDGYMDAELPGTISGAKAADLLRSLL